MTFLEDAHNRLKKYFSNGAWEIYDGVEVARDSELTVCDIVLSSALNSRINRDSLWRIWRNKYQIEQYLDKIPIDLRLESEYILWDELTTLFDAFCKNKYVKEAITTKILHKKRPELIPVCDSVLYNYFKTQLRSVWSRGGGVFIVKYMQLFRDILLTHNSEIYSLCEYTNDEGWPITPVRALEVLIWIDNEDKGEYR